MRVALLLVLLRLLVPLLLVVVLLGLLVPLLLLLLLQGLHMLHVPRVRWPSWLRHASLHGRRHRLAWVNLLRGARRPWHSLLLLLPTMHAVRTMHAVHGGLRSRRAGDSL